MVVESIADEWWLTNYSWGENLCYKGVETNDFPLIKSQCFTYGLTECVNVYLVQTCKAEHIHE